MKGLVFVALTERGAALAGRLLPFFPGAELHGYAQRVAGARRAFADVGAHLSSLFGRGRPIVGLCASGILIRALAPHLADKRTEPPVLALAEDGSAAVPLLGGHRGANELARRLAALTGGRAAVTTGSDVAFGVALDRPPPGWKIADDARVKPVAAALLAGRRVRVKVDAADASWLAGVPQSNRSRWTVSITDRATGSPARTLVYHPPVLAVGVGAERSADPAELDRLVAATFRRHGLTTRAVAGVFSIDLKADELAIHALAARLDVPARFLTAEQLTAEEHRVRRPSEIVRRAVGTASVAEAAALVAAGPGGGLVVAKTKSARCTVAVARSPRPIDAGSIGRARGRLDIVGIGPGGPSWRTPEVSNALAHADDIVGYGLYLDLLGDEVARDRQHRSPIGQERERVRHALELAASGRRVALVSSGDAGIYGLATLAYEMAAGGENPAWQRIEIATLPGISALQAAAARAGAPLGHDFAAVSLSDLLTPWPVIERRIKAARDGDLVLALYNPASQRRRRAIGAVRKLMLRARAPETPVVLARELGRPGESVEIAALGDDWTDRVDMLTIVLIGARGTRRVDLAGAARVFTPRGYAVGAPPARRKR